MRAGNFVWSSGKTRVSTASIMKTILTALTLAGLMTLTSCYVGVESGHRHHHGGSVIIHTSAETNQKDSLASPAFSTTTQKDSLASPVKTGEVK